MTNNQIQYWKVVSDRDKWNAEVDVARTEAETRRNAQIEQARHNLVDEELRRALNDIDREYKEALVQIDSEYKSRMAAVNEQKNRIDARNVEINAALGRESNAINRARMTNDFSIASRDQARKGRETQSVIDYNEAKIAESNAKAIESTARAADLTSQTNWRTYDKIMGTIDTTFGHIEKVGQIGVNLLDAVIPDSIF